MITRETPVECRVIKRIAEHFDVQKVENAYRATAPMITIRAYAFYQLWCDIKLKHVEFEEACIEYIAKKSHFILQYSFR